MTRQATSRNWRSFSNKKSLLRMKLSKNMSVICFHSPGYTCLPYVMQKEEEARRERKEAEERARLEEEALVKELLPDSEVGPFDFFLY